MHLKRKHLSIVLAILSSQATANPHEYLQLEEIIVTAQHKEQRLKEVPLSVSVVDSDTIDAIFVSGDDVRALANQAPGFYVESSNGRIAPRFYLRGLGNVDFDLAASQPVSMIVDDVVRENVVLKSFPLFDLERVEVARGPQGTLFGRNTTAGVIKFNSVKPSHETDGFLRANYGSHDSVNVEAAYGGALIKDALSGRVSLLSNNRGDWIDNTYTGDVDAFGGHKELAGRLQLLWELSDNFSALLNVHARDLDGSQTAFRANVFTTGSNNLNETYDRDTVYYNGGNNNAQKYSGNGSSLTLDWKSGNVNVVSITALEKASGSNTGDIDGGVAGDGPGFIPFDSETVDLGDVEQLTQEVRINNATWETFEWQAGAHYFDSKLKIHTDAGFNAATVEHNNEAWAVFGHGTYHFTEKFKLGTGVRYTDDSKTLDSAGVDQVKAGDDQVSWDISANYLYSDELSVYARVADGFKAPTIQGRDIAFFGAPSVADSENIISYELGFNSELYANKLQVNGSIYYYEIDGFQLTAIGGATNSNRLLNSDEGVGQGFEMDVIATPTDNLRVTAGFSYNKTEIKDVDLYTAVCGSMQCTPTDPINEDGFANIDGNPFPGAPEKTFNMTLRYQHPLSNGALVYVFTDVAYQGPMNLALYESKEFITNSQYEAGVRLGYNNPNKGYDIALFGRNITDESNVKGFVDFNNNTGFVNEPRLIGIEGRYSF